MPDELKTTSNVISLVNDMIGINARFASKTLMNRMLTISGLGSIVKDIIVMVPSKPDPVLLKLKELDGKTDDLSHKMSFLFDDLKSFMVSHSFFKRFATCAATLMKLMRHTITNPNEHSRGIFRKECESTPPLRYALDFISQLEQEETNPLKAAMKADPLKTRDSFCKWKRIIDGVLGEFLFLECYLNGMFWNANMYGPNQLEAEIDKVLENIEKWYLEYHDENEGWNGVKKFVEEVQDNYQCVGNDKKASIIRNKLDDILTYDSYYILVYNDCGGYDNHSFNHNTDNFISSFRRGKCNVVVYRTQYTHQTDRVAHAAKLDEAIKNLPEYNAQKCYRELAGSIRDKLEQNNKCGFVGLIRYKNNVSTYWVNCDYMRGPGAFTTIKTADRWVSMGFISGKVIHGDTFYLVAGLA